MRVSQFGLEINRPENCAAQLDSGVQASVHYHDVRRRRGRPFVIALDVERRHPGLRRPRPGATPSRSRTSTPATSTPARTSTLDNAWGHVRYVPETGHIWFATASGGFWVVELEPQVRRYLQVQPPAPPLHLDGAPGARGAEPVDLPSARELPPVWCTLGVATSKL